MCSLTDYFHFHWMIQLLTVIPNSENNKKETVPTHYPIRFLADSDD